MPRKGRQRMVGRQDAWHRQETEELLQELRVQLNRDVERRRDDEEWHHDQAGEPEWRD